MGGGTVTRLVRLMFDYLMEADAGNIYLGQSLLFIVNLILPAFTFDYIKRMIRLYSFIKIKYSQKQTAPFD